MNIKTTVVIGSVTLQDLPKRRFGKFSGKQKMMNIMFGVFYNMHLLFKFRFCGHRNKTIQVGFRKM